MKLNLIAFALALNCGAVYAQGVDIQDAWVRTAVPGQLATAAFMKITAEEKTTLVSVSSPVAGVAEIHEMKMDGGIMKMRAVAGGLELQPGKAVALTPGGYHVMMMDLKAALPKGGTVPMTLVFRDAKGRESRVELTLPVAASAAAAHRH